MPYLIDGHNLIGQTPTLSLTDPDDEAQLVQLVKRLCLREQRTATIIFDNGLTGGKSGLSTSDVEVIFATNPSIADDLIIKRINATKNPQGTIVISSDQRIVTTAQRKRLPVKSSAEFGRLLLKAATAVTPQKEKGLSAEEAAQWEELFKQGKK